MKIINIAIDKIHQNENSRAILDHNDLSDLMLSLKKNGLLQPVGVMKTNLGYEAVFGNRRILAARKLGWAEVPAVVLDIDSDIDRDILNLLENQQRVAVTLKEEGRL